MTNFANFVTIIKCRIQMLKTGVMKKSLMVLVLSLSALFTTPCYGEVRERVVDGDHREIDTLSYCVGAAYAVTIKADSTLVAFDYDISQFNDGVMEHLTSQAELTYDEAASKLEPFLTQRLVEYRKRLAEEPSAEVKLFESDEERNQLSYAFGVYWGEQVLKPLSVGDEVIHYYWLCKAFEDVYNGKIIVPIDTMISFLKSRMPKVAASEQSEVVEAPATTEPVSTEPVSTEPASTEPVPSVEVEKPAEVPATTVEAITEVATGLKSADESVVEVIE